MKPLFLGFAGTQLTGEEASFFREVEPAGYILFRRNVETPDQVKALTASLRDLSGRDDLPILIDQEGGRVARLAPPVWPAFPAGERFAALYARAPVSAIEAIRSNALTLAIMLAELGITVDCLPVLDVPVPGAHDVIGDRALGHEPTQVAALGAASLEGLARGGVVGVIKHIPGHGRATADSHVEMPVVDASRDALETDLAPFRKLRDAPMAMTAHVIYTALDPERCASLSPFIINDIIRGEIGFDGLLMSDDLGMHALQGSFGARASGVIEAGCDIALHCLGDMAEMRDIAAAVGEISPRARERLQRAMAMRAAHPDTDFAAAVAHRDALLAMAGQEGAA